MKKIGIIICFLIFCGIAKSQGIYTPIMPTIYGQNFLRIKPMEVLHIPSFNDTLSHTLDTSAQIRLINGVPMFHYGSSWKFFAPHAGDSAYYAGYGIKIISNYIIADTNVLVNMRHFYSTIDSLGRLKLNIGDTSVFARKATTITINGDTHNLSNNIVFNIDTSHFIRDNDTLTYTNGLIKSGKTVSALNLNAMWNAFQLRGVPISSILPTNGQSLVYNSSADRWEPQTISGGGTGGDNNYVNSFVANQNTLTISRQGLSDLPVHLDTTYFEKKDAAKKSIDSLAVLINKEIFAGTTSQIRALTTVYKQYINTDNNLVYRPDNTDAASADNAFSTLITNTDVRIKSKTPDVLGYRYNKNNWADLSDFNTDSAAFGISFGKIVTTASSNGRLSLKYKTALDKYTISLTYKATNGNYSQDGLYFGLTSTNTTASNVSYFVYLNEASGDASNVDAFKLVAYNSYTGISYKSSEKLSYTAGDKVELTINFSRGKYAIRAVNVSLPIGSINREVNINYLYDSFDASNPSPTLSSNTAQVTVYTPNYFGSSTSADYEIESLSHFSSTPVNADALAVGHSIVEGTAAGSPEGRWAELIGAEIDAGAGDKTDEVLAHIDEIIALHPKTVYLDISTNDFDLSVWETNYASIVNQLEAAGIRVVKIAPSPNNGRSMLPYKTWIASTYPTSYIDCYTPLLGTGTNLNANYDAGDGTHLNTAGHLAFANAIKASSLYVIPTNQPVIQKTIEEKLRQYYQAKDADKKFLNVGVGGTVRSDLNVTGQLTTQGATSTVGGTDRDNANAGYQFFGQGGYFKMFNYGHGHDGDMYRINYANNYLEYFGGANFTGNVTTIPATTSNHAVILSQLHDTANAIRSIGYLTNITGLVTAGTNVTVTGSGTSGSPYVVSAVIPPLVDTIYNNGVADSLVFTIAGRRHAVNYQPTYWTKTGNDINNDNSGIVNIGTVKSWWNVFDLNGYKLKVFGKQIVVDSASIANLRIHNFDTTGSSSITLGTGDKDCNSCQSNIISFGRNLTYPNKLNFQHWGSVWRWGGSDFDFYIPSSVSGDTIVQVGAYRNFEIKGANHKFIMHSPDGTAHNVTVTNTPALALDGVEIGGTGGGSIGTLQQTTDAGNTTTRQMFTDSSITVMNSTTDKLKLGVASYSFPYQGLYWSGSTPTNNTAGSFIYQLSSDKRLNIFSPSQVVIGVNNSSRLVVKDTSVQISVPLDISSVGKGIYMTSANASQRKQLTLNNSGNLSLDGVEVTGSGSGVSSIALTTPSWLTVGGSPVTASGTLAVTATTGQTANQFLSTPNGSTGAVGLRSIVAADIPTLNQSTTGTAASVTGTNVVSNSNLSQMSTNTIKGNNTGSTANAADLTVSQVKTMLSISNVDNTSDATKNSATATLTNKRWTARVGSTTSSATPTINTDNVDVYKLTAQAADITSFTTNLTGTPNDGDVFEVEITGTASRAIAWGSSFVSSSITLPTTTSSTTTLTVIFQYYTNSSYGNNKWICVNSY